MSNSTFNALTLDDIASIREPIENVIGEEQRARAEGKVVNIRGGWVNPAAYQGRLPPAPDHKLMDPLCALSPDARDELKALVLFGRGDYASFQDSLHRVRSMAGEGQVEYLYSKLITCPEYIEQGLKKVGETIKP